MHRSKEHHSKRVLSGVAAPALALALAAAPLTVHAEAGPDLLTDPFRVSLGAFILESDVSVRLDGETDVGTDVDFNRTTKDDDDFRFRLDGQWRFGERHKLRAMYFSNTNEKSRTLDEEIVWQDETFPIGAKVKGEFEIDVVMLAYDYSFLKRDNYELFAGIGLHYTDVATSLSARVEIEGGEGGVDGSINGGGDVGLPLPVIGVGGLWSLPHDFWISGSFQLFALEIDNIDGTLTDGMVAVIWQPKPWLGIGLAYNRFDVDVDVDKNRFKGNLEWTYDGPMLFYNASF
jgi:hypothetical protein